MEVLEQKKKKLIFKRIGNSLFKSLKRFRYTYEMWIGILDTYKIFLFNFSWFFIQSNTNIYSTGN